MEKHANRGLAHSTDTSVSGDFAVKYDRFLAEMQVSSYMVARGPAWLLW